MKKNSLQATSLRNVLTFLIIILLTASIAGFYFAQDWLNNMSNDISKNSTSTSSNDSSPQTLINIQTEISKNKAAAEKAKSVLSTSSDYKNQMAKDIRAYASNVGIAIKDVSTSQPAQTSSMGSGIQVGYAVVTFVNPVSIQNLLLFFKGIESNLPKMQVTAIDLSRDQGSNGVVSVKPITIEEYFR
jgi:hypothetical protein